MAILLTGGAGYIGSHVLVKLLQAKTNVVVIDNLSNSNPEVFNRIKAITNQTVNFIHGDIRDAECLKNIFQNFKINSVMHFAGLKSVRESEENPAIYFDNNLIGSKNLLEQMSLANVKSIIFSSSATVYGAPIYLPYKEEHPLNPINTYGKTKLLVEKILTDLANQDDSWRISVLRYFNPVGAHHSGLIGECPSGIPNNLMPVIARVAASKDNFVSIFGSDYETPDGTGIRDYIHIDDLCNGHLAALSYINQHTGISFFNLGTGIGTSVLELIHAFEKIINRRIPVRLQLRREGDLASYWADPSKANETLGWSAKLDIHNMCQDTWHWQTKNPNGY